MLGLSATSFDERASETVIVQTYDNATGMVTLTGNLTWYHWGKNESTAPKYGVDMRGEVLILNKTVRIIGDGVDGWGGQILTGYMLDFDLSSRNGRTILDNVEIYNCSQRDTHNAALRWESNTNGYS